MTATLLPPGKQSYEDDNGLPLIGGKLFTYLAGTSTPAPTWSDADQGALNTNPIILDTRGEASVFWNGAYKIVLKDALDNVLWTQDDCVASDLGNYVSVADLASTASGKGAGLVGFSHAATYAAATDGRKLQQFVDLRDAPYNAVLDGIADDTAAFEAALAAFGVQGGVLRAAGILRITDTVRINKPISFIGDGEGEAYQPSEEPGLAILYDGPAGQSAIEYGGFGATIVGGGLRDLMIDGNGLASVCILNKDHERGDFRNLTLDGCTEAAWEMQNTAGLLTGSHEMSDIRMPLRNLASSVNAHGFKLNGTLGGSGGVSLCTINRARIDHQNGAGVWVGDIGDNMTWIMLQTYRADADTGPGVWFNSTNPSAICGTHLFLNPTVSAGFRFDTPGLHGQTRIINDNVLDVNSGSLRMFGAGCGEVNYVSALGFERGGGLVPSMHSSLTRDSMSVIRYDSANEVLQTANGAWKVARVGTGTITDAGQPGGATALTTSASSGDSVAIFDAATISGGGGWYLEHGALADCIAAPVNTTNIVVRVGFMNATGDTVTEGVYWEFDPATDANWRCISTDGGVTTAVVSALGGASSIVDLSIYVSPDNGAAVFYYRTPGNSNSGLGANISTNVPDGGLPFCARVKTTTGSTRAMHVYSIKVGSPDEAVSAT